MLGFAPPSVRKKKTILKEQKYLDLLNPKYNILKKKAGSMAGFKHSEKTLAKFRARILTLEQRVRQIEALKILHENKEYQAKRNEAIMYYNSSEKRSYEAFIAFSGSN